jgi:hypothetical protein
MGFKVGRTYSRRQISAKLGGSIQSYLPTKEGRVLCGCFKPTPRYNPEAPEKITTGGVSDNAIWISNHDDPIPVFVFRSDSAWEYMGRYRCTGVTTKLEVLRREMKKNPARGRIAGVLFFKRVGN